MAEYLKDGAKLKCSAGKEETSLVVTNAKNVAIQKAAAANETDNKIISNVPIFGECKLLPNPSGGYYPCNTKAATLEWKSTKSDVNIGGAKSVIDSSFMTCSVGGIIKPSDSGQN